MSLLEKFDNPQADRKRKAEIWRRIKDKHPELERAILETREVFGTIELEEFEEDV